MSIYNPYGSYQPQQPSEPQKPKPYTPRNKAQAKPKATPQEQTGQPYMMALNQWIDKEVIYPLLCRADNLTEEENNQLILGVMKMIREKVLESYNNGRNANS